jgi:hypothetical protein
VDDQHHQILNQCEFHAMPTYSEKNVTQNKASVPMGRLFLLLEVLGGAMCHELEGRITPETLCIGRRLLSSQEKFETTTSGR